MNNCSPHIIYIVLLSKEGIRHAAYTGSSFILITQYRFCSTRNPLPLTGQEHIQNDMFHYFSTVDTQTYYTPQVRPHQVQTHDFQIKDSTFHVPEMLTLTTEQSRTSLFHSLVCPSVYISKVKPLWYF